MKLVWGLYLPTTPINIYQFDNKFWAYINYHRLSIKIASDMGYDCHLYLNKEICKYYQDLNVTLHIVDKLKTTFFDAITFYILDTEHKNDLILDGDIILNKKIPDIKADIVYEMKETHSWEWLYEFWVNALTDIGINDIIPEWTGKKYTQIINIGAIQIQNNKFRGIYLERWKTLRDFINKNIDNLPYKGTDKNPVEYTTVAAQYLLTELANYYNMHTIDLKPLKVYKHYVGTQKFTNNLVPYDRILVFTNENLI